MAANNQYNLDINEYSFDEVLDIFNLSYQISETDMKGAKKKVLMMHPDKSRLPPEYFLFYKKALDIVFNYYTNQNRMNVQATPDKLAYNSKSETYDGNVHKKIADMKSGDFNKMFNEVYEKNVGKKQSTKNEWFKDETGDYTIKETVSKSNMGQAFDSVRQRAADNSIVRYNGYQNIVHNSSGSNNYYEEDEDDTSVGYISSDLFSKLKFDDIRKVHRDQTVLAVSERDFGNVKTYGSVDEYNRARGGQTIEPISKAEANAALKKQEDEYNKRMAQKQHKDMLNMRKYEEINKAVMATFLQLENKGR